MGSSSLEDEYWSVLSEIRAQYLDELLALVRHQPSRPASTPQKAEQMQRLRTPYHLVAQHDRAFQHRKRASQAE